jgi:hypothetical protein
MAGEGVPLHQLRCPTCGALYEDFNLRSDPDELEFGPIQTQRFDSILTPARWYLLCPNEHKWTIKTLWRAVNHPDRVLLDRFIGGP